MRIVLPREKIQKICGEATHLAQKSMVTIRELAAFVGMTNAVKQAIFIAPLFHHHIQALINRVVAQAEQREVKQQYQRMAVLTPEAQAELLWWARTAKTYNSAPLIQPPPDLVIETDASLSGWGARCQELRTGGLWSVEEQMMHINALELLAVFLAIKTFSKGKDCLNILIRTDNMTAKAYINHRGGTHSQTLNSIATQLWKWCLDHQVHLTAEYLPGVENKIADEESRVVKDRCDWMIHPQVFDQINTRWGPVEVDMFASRLTHQVPRFFSWGLDPAAEAVNAFNQDWSQFVGYANSPWCLILSVLAKIRRDRAKVILVAPVWSTQPWYPLILQLLYDVPCLLPKRDDLVISPSQREFIMPTGVPQLAAWPLSGNSASQEAFQQMLLGCSQHPGETRPPHLMNPSSKSGTAGVWKGAEIPLGVL